MSSQELRGESRGSELRLCREVVSLTPAGHNEELNTELRETRTLLEGDGDGASLTGALSRVQEHVPLVFRHVNERRNSQLYLRGTGALHVVRTADLSDL